MSVNVGVEISEQTLTRIHTILTGLENAEKKVLNPALARGKSAAKVEIIKNIRETYHILPGTLSEYSKVKDKLTTGAGGIIGSIEYSGTVIPLYKFHVTPKSPTYGKSPISVNVMRDHSEAGLEHAFVAQMKNGHRGVFERVEAEPDGGLEKRGAKTRRATLNKHTQRIEEKYSPSAPQMAGNEKVMESVEKKVNEVINRRIEHEIERLLRG